MGVKKEMRVNQPKIVICVAEIMKEIQFAQRKWPVLREKGQIWPAKTVIWAFKDVDLGLEVMMSQQECGNHLTYRMYR